MSLLLDVTDPSIHFRARQCCSNTSSKPFSTTEPSLKAPTAVAPTSIPSTATPIIPSMMTKHNLFSSALPASSSSSVSSAFAAASGAAAAAATTIPTNNMFSAMSRMIISASSSSTTTMPSFIPSFSTSSTSSTAVSPPSSRPNTPDVTNVSDPFMANTNSFLSARSNNGPTSSASSPWMIPSVCDDDQMNKLVSFQL